jgi:predicted 3-demethylubiquinone-9 3-methyltransferase (glyoxalase superfamily)
MQKIAPCLWFDNQAVEAVNFYISVFNNSKILNEIKVPSSGNGSNENILGLSFQIEGEQFMALNGNKDYKFNHSVSLYVNCKDQDEVDRIWGRLLEGGKEVQCGWLTDKYGVSWQIIPVILSEIIADKDPVKAGRVFNAMMQMVKIDVDKIKKAYQKE